jgi:hypothetical protein
MVTNRASSPGDPRGVARRARDDVLRARNVTVKSAGPDAPQKGAFAPHSRRIRTAFAPHSHRIRTAFAPHSRRDRAACAPRSRLGRAALAAR